MMKLDASLGCNDKDSEKKVEIADVLLIGHGCLLVGGHQLISQWWRAGDATYFWASSNMCNFRHQEFDKCWHGPLQAT